MSRGRGRACSYVPQASDTLLRSVTAGCIFQSCTINMVLCEYASQAAVTGRAPGPSKGGLRGRIATAAAAQPAQQALSRRQGLISLGSAGLYINSGEYCCRISFFVRLHDCPLMIPETSAAPSELDLFWFIGSGCAIASEDAYGFSALQYEKERDLTDFRREVTVVLNIASA